MTNTKQWAASHGLCVDDIVPPVDDYSEPHKRTAEDVVIRSIILHCVAAVGYGVDPQPVIAWLKEQSIWGKVTRNEQVFLCVEDASDKERSDARWRQEAQWALLWAIGKVEALGLPTQTCDTARLVDEIMPALGESIDRFVSSAVLLPPAVVLGEDDRTYNLHCYARKAYRDGSMPDDLVLRRPVSTSLRIRMAKRRGRLGRRDSGHITIACNGVGGRVDFEVNVARVDPLMRIVRLSALPHGSGWWLNEP